MVRVATKSNEQFPLPGPPILYNILVAGIEGCSNSTEDWSQSPARSSRIWREFPGRRGDPLRARTWTLIMIQSVVIPEGRQTIQLVNI